MNIRETLNKVEAFVTKHKVEEKANKTLEMGKKATLKTKDTAAHIFGIAKAMGEAARNYEAPKK